MKISARVRNDAAGHAAEVQTGETAQAVAIAAKPVGRGSSANGGELLFLALATCYCNDIFREAAKRGIAVESVEVAVEGDFGAEGEPARNITYRAVVRAAAGEAAIADMMRAVDGLAEVQNTLRGGAGVALTEITAIETAR